MSKEISKTLIGPQLLKEKIKQCFYSTPLPPLLKKKMQKVSKKVQKTAQKCGG